MKKTIILTLFTVLWLSSLFAAQEAVKLNPAVSNVTVYQGRALVERFASADIAAGETLFTVTGLPYDMYQNTLLVYKSDKDAPFLIKEFDFKDVEANVILSAEEKRLKAKLENLNELFKSKQDRIEVLKNKMKFYADMSAKTSGQSGEAMGVKPVDVKNAGDVLSFISAGIEAALKEKRSCENQMIKIQDDINITQSELSELYTRNTGTAKVLYIRLASNSQVKAGIKLKYIVPNAGWFPSYECNYDSAAGVIEAKYYANIQQSTTEKWSNTKLSIATGSPLYDVTLPIARPWVLSEQQQYRANGNAGMMMKAAAAPMALSEEASADSAVMEKRKYEAAPEAVENYQYDELGIKANLTGRFDVLNTGEVKKAALKEMKLKRKETFYTAIPSQNDSAYLTVEFENNDDMIMLPGETTLYIDGNYSGKASIGENIRKGQTVKFAFGIDENLKIKKEKLQEKKGESGIFGSERKVDFGYRLTAENYKAKEAVIYIKEPLPFSEDDRIKVELYETSDKVTSEEDRGVKVWKITLKPGDKKEITYRFRVTCPKDMAVNGL